MKTINIRERFGFGFGVLGQNMIYGLVSSFILIYYTDVVLLPPAFISLLFVAARVWDAVNDPMMGVVVDHTKTRWGKFRPYLLFLPIPIAIITVLVFSVPNLSMQGKMVYAAVTYVLWGMIFTGADIPMWSLTSVITDDREERTGITSLISLFSFIGILGASLLVVPLLQAFGGESSASAYQRVAVIFGVFGAVTMMGIFFSTKERVQPVKKERITFKETLQTLYKNKPLLLIMLALLISTTAMTLLSAMMIFFAKYNLGDAAYVTNLMGAIFLPLMIGTALTNVVARRIGKKRTFMITSLLRVVTLIAFFFMGYDNLTLVYVMMGLNGFFSAFPTVLLTAMISDSVDYAQWQLGIRSEGLAFSMRTFTAKLASAISGGFSALLLSVVAFVPNGTVQPASALSGFFNTLTLYSAILIALGIVPMIFYTLTEEKMDEIKTALGKAA